MRLDKKDKVGLDMCKVVGLAVRADAFGRTERQGGQEA